MKNPYLLNDNSDIREKYQARILRELAAHEKAQRQSEIITFGAGGFMLCLSFWLMLTV